jgi:hypothetical protein
MYDIFKRPPFEKFPTYIFVVRPLPRHPHELVLFNASWPLLAAPIFRHADMSERNLAVLTKTRFR